MKRKSEKIPLIPDHFGHGVVVSVMVPTMGNIDLFEN